MIVRNTLIGSVAFLALSTICLVLATPGKETEIPGRTPSAAKTNPAAHQPGSHSIPKPEQTRPDGIQVLSTDERHEPRASKESTMDVKKQKQIVKEFVDLMNSYEQHDEVVAKDVDKLFSYMTTPFTFIKKSRSKADIKQMMITKPNVLRTFAEEMFGQFSVEKDFPLDEITPNNAVPKLEDKTYKTYRAYQITKRSPDGRTSQLLLYLNHKNRVIALGAMKYREQE